jgi:hypothetical protein
MDRIVIEVTGSLPDETKYDILAAAKQAANAMATELNTRFEIKLVADVRPVRPGKGKAPAPVVRAVAAE